MTEKESKNNLLKAALEYAGMGFSVIPVDRNSKKPLIKWKEFQQRRATPDEIREWWGKWPDANVGIVTGKISNLAVIDQDTEGGKEAIEKLIPDSLHTPT